MWQWIKRISGGADPEVTIGAGLTVDEASRVIEFVYDLIRERSYRTDSVVVSQALIIEPRGPQEVWRCGRIVFKSNNPIILVGAKDEKPPGSTDSYMKPSARLERLIVEFEFAVRAAIAEARKHKDGE